MTTTITAIIASSKAQKIARTSTAMVKVGAELEFTISHDLNGLESHKYILSKIQNGHKIPLGAEFSSVVSAVASFNQLRENIATQSEKFMHDGGGSDILHGEFCSQKGCSGTRGTCGRLNGFVA
jgi:hypothetical protein